MIRVTPTKRLHVLVVTPLGRGGNGGIDRLIDFLRDAIDISPPPDIAVRFAVTRGKGSIVLAPLHLLGTLLLVIALRLTGKVDLVHINISAWGSTYRKMIVSGLSHALGLPTIIHLHSGEYPQFCEQAKPWLQRRIASLFQRARRVVVLGETWAHFVSSAFPGSRPVILLNATPTFHRDERNASGHVQLLFLGRLGAHKGVPELVDALASLVDIPNWSMVIAGDGDIEQMRARVAQLGLGDRVEVPGWVGPDGVRQLLAEADVLVLPSHGENLPMSVIEGMSAGLAIVATPVGAIPEVVTDQVSALLVPIGDKAALASAIKEIVTDPVLRTRLGAAAQATHRDRLEIGTYLIRLCEIWRDAEQETTAI